MSLQHAVWKAPMELHVVVKWYKIHIMKFPNVHGNGKRTFFSILHYFVHAKALNIAIIWYWSIFWSRLGVNCALFSVQHYFVHAKALNIAIIWYWSTFRSRLGVNCAL